MDAQSLAALETGDTLFWCDSMRGTVKEKTDEFFTVQWGNGNAVTYPNSTPDLKLIWTCQEFEELMERRMRRAES